MSCARSAGVLRPNGKILRHFNILSRDPTDKDRIAFLSIPPRKISAAMKSAARKMAEPPQSLTRY
jgi:hypothetical protein